jgi:hypothetical protein
MPRIIDQSYRWERVYLFAQGSAEPYLADMRIVLRAGCRDESEAAVALRARLALTLGRFGARLVRVEIRRLRVAGEGRWRVDVTSDDGSTMCVEEALGSAQDGAIEHFADRVARSVALRMGRESVR